MKVSELTGEKLAYWVAMAQGWVRISEYYWKDADGNTVIDGVRYEPHINGGQCFELIDEFDVWLSSDSYDMNRADWWVASTMDTHVAAEGWEHQTGTTPQEAICRAVVASVYGEEVSDES